MHNKLLITFGCSWTFGVGAGYTSNMQTQEYKDIAWNKTINDNLSYRGILSKEFQFDNISFAGGGSSNQRQFRLAKEFFVSDKFSELKQNYESICVLWAITSTARNEMFSLETGNLENFKYETSELKLSKMMLTLSYEHDYEVTSLNREMLFWNDYFLNKKIRNLWLDTFNHHNYLMPITNLIGTELPARDMLSLLAINNGMANVDENYHSSTWKVDSNRVQYLIGKGILNPISTHPTKLGHQQIAEIISPYIKQHFLRP